jgi:hypothetical protein
VVGWLLRRCRQITGRVVAGEMKVTPSIHGIGVKLAHEKEIEIMYEIVLPRQKLGGGSTWLTRTLRSSDGDTVIQLGEGIRGDVKVMYIWHSEFRDITILMTENSTSYGFIQDCAKYDSVKQSMADVFGRAEKEFFYLLGTAISDLDVARLFMRSLQKQMAEARSDGIASAQAAMRSALGIA